MTELITGDVMMNALGPPKAQTGRCKVKGCTMPTVYFGSIDEQSVSWCAAGHVCVTHSCAVDAYKAHVATSLVYTF